MADASWIDGADTGPFPLENLPFGVFQTPEAGRPEAPEASGRTETPEASGQRIGVAIGDQVLDVGALARDHDWPDAAELSRPTLNDWLALGPDAWDATRAWLTRCLSAPDARADVERRLVPRAEVRMHCPIEVADYVDFYASEHHAANVGRLFRPDGDPLLPNWKHLPVGYHGRAGTVVVSGTEIVRPCGQRKAPEDDAPSFGPSQRLDFEAELGFVVGAPSPRATPLGVDDFPRHVFGVCLVNDWSARDVQAWEYVPLGPFLGKSFATSISPWIVPLAALERARVAPPERDVPLLPHLRDGARPWGLAIDFEVELNGEILARPPARCLYWTGAQMLAHLTSNGASLRSGDLFASGTISGPEPDTWGALIELTRGGREPITLADGSQRAYLEDGDEVILRATAPGLRGRGISLGEVRGRVTPARGGRSLV